MKSFVDRPSYFASFALLLLACTLGCAPSESSAPELQMELTLTPSPPVVGEAGVGLTVKKADGTPVSGANVKLEGNMNHAGMKPSFADLTEASPGQYEGTLDFTMGGDWFVLVTVKTDEGQTVERKIDVPGVKTE